MLERTKLGGILAPPPDEKWIGLCMLGELKKLIALNSPQNLSFKYGPSLHWPLRTYVLPARGNFLGAFLGPLVDLRCAAGAVSGSTGSLSTGAEHRRLSRSVSEFKAV